MVQQEKKELHRNVMDMSRGKIRPETAKVGRGQNNLVHIALEMGQD